MARRKKVTLMVDADPLVYACGFAAQKHEYILNWVDVTPDGDEEHFARFESAWRRDAFIDHLNLHPEETASHVHVIPYPKAHALNIVNTALRYLHLAVEAFLSEINMLPGDTRLFLTGGENYRDRIATIRPYKGNRDRNKRPFWYEEIRRHLISAWDAEVENGREADDALAMLQWQEDPESPRTIVCSVDKDLKMVPGLHYNTKSKQSFHVSFPDAMLNFYRQVLIGDASDNIPGLYRVGEAAAKKILPQHAEERVMYAACLSAYGENMAKFPDHHLPHTDPAASLLENARLLWLQTHDDDLWTPPGTPPMSLRAWLATLEPVDPDAELSNAK